MKSYLSLIRVHQWIKNLFVFAPLFFSGHLLQVDKLQLSLVAFIAFCLNASSLYIINDIADVEKDRLHPIKRNRAIASGKISKTKALLLFFLCATVSFVLAFSMDSYLSLVLLIYFALNLLYSFWLKKIHLIDVFIIAIGFVLRVLAGGVITGIEISHWLYIMTFLIALFIAFAKRRDDVLIQINSGEKMRQAIDGYNLEFISSAISLLSGVLIVAYLLYITSPEITERFRNKHAYISALFVIMGILQYLQITLVQNKSGSPTKLLLKDTFLQVTVALWVLFFAFIIYIR